jgi:hypothetical protein
MHQQNKMSVQILSSILALAGICGTANATTSKVEIDDAAAAQIVRALAADQREELDSILNAGSMDELTPEQQEKLLKIVHAAASRVMRSAPIA